MEGCPDLGIGMSVSHTPGSLGGNTYDALVAGRSTIFTCNTATRPSMAFVPFIPTDR